MFIKAQAAEQLLNIISGKELAPIVKYTPNKPQADLDTHSDVFTVMPEDVGISSIKLNKMLKEMERAKEANIHNIVIIKDGKTVLDTAFYPYRRDIWHITHSACKTLTSMAIGILVSRGLLDVNKKLTDIFDSEMNIVAKLKLNKITVRHLLTMSSGLSANELMIVSQKDWLKAALDSNLIFEPGSKFQYNSINSYLLSCITEKIAGENLFSFIKENLLNEMEITNVYWETCPMGRTKGGWGLYMLPSDMAKLGVFLLNKGKWKGKEIIKEEYINEMISPAMKSDEKHGLEGYGYQVWTGKKEGNFVFNGMLGQNIHCFQDTGTVVAVTGGNHELFGKCEVNSIINKYFGEGEIFTDKRERDVKAYRDLLKTANSLENQAYKIKSEESLIKRLNPFAKKKELNKELYALNGKSYRLENKSLRLQPLFMSVINNSYPQGISEISFEKGDDKMFLNIKEGEKINRLPLCTDEFQLCDIDINGEKYKAAVMCRFTKDEDDTPVLKISLPLLEQSNGRMIKIFFLSKDRIRIKMQEIPGRKVIEGGIMGISYMFPDKGGFSFLKKIDPYLVKRISAMVTEPEAEAVLSL